MRRLLLLPILIFSCKEKEPASPRDPNVIGPEGGLISVDGFTIEFPPGAVAEEIRVVLKRATLPTNSELVAVSAVWSCAPNGITFLKPVRVSLPVTDPDPSTLTFYWSATTPDFEPIPGAVIVGGVATGTILHFSVGFVGRARPNLTPDAGTADAGGDPPDGGDPADGGDPNPDAAVVCTDLTVFADVDTDGYGVDGDTRMVCLDPNEEEPGYARQSGDCLPVDSWANPGASEICGDKYDDDCNGVDSDCPTTQTANLDIPQWDCSGNPPVNVYAYGTFASGGGYYQDGGCFMIFEGLPDEFYVRHTLVRVSNDPDCPTVEGCVCPSLNSWPSYDRRLYAFTWNGDADPACELTILDNGSELQTVSTACRKYLYQMHWPNNEITEPFVAGSVAELDRRLALFPTLEVACAHDAPHVNLPYQQLLTTSLVKNSGFVKK